MVNTKLGTKNPKASQIISFCNFSLWGVCVCVHWFEYKFCLESVQMFLVLGCSIQ